MNLTGLKLKRKQTTKYGINFTFYTSLFSLERIVNLLQRYYWLNLFKLNEFLLFDSNISSFQMTFEHNKTK